MRFRVSIKETAHEDIQRNALWWAEHHSVEQAIRWKDAIYRQIRTLETMPKRHPLAPENSKFRYDIDEKPVGLGSRPSYRAIYTIVESEVHVLTVRRAEQDSLDSSDM